MGCVGVTVGVGGVCVKLRLDKIVIQQGGVDLGGEAW